MSLVPLTLTGYKCVLTSPGDKSRLLAAIQSFPVLHSGRTRNKAKTLINVNKITDIKRCLGVTESGELGYYY